MSNDLISRHVAIDALGKDPGFKVKLFGKSYDEGRSDQWFRDVYILTTVPSAQPEQRWIPCSERLPEQGQEVICQCRASIIQVLKLDANGDWYQDARHCYMSGFVIAWMPLPEPYKEEEKK